MSNSSQASPGTTTEACRGVGELLEDPVRTSSRCPTDHISIRILQSLAVVLGLRTRMKDPCVSVVPVAPVVTLASYANTGAKLQAPRPSAALSETRPLHSWPLPSAEFLRCSSISSVNTKPKRTQRGKNPYPSIRSYLTYQLLLPLPAAKTVSCGSAGATTYPKRNTLQTCVYIYICIHTHMYVFGASLETRRAALICGTVRCKRSSEPKIDSESKCDKPQESTIV